MEDLSSRTSPARPSRSKSAVALRTAITAAVEATEHRATAAHTVRDERYWGYTAGALTSILRGPVVAASNPSPPAVATEAEPVIHTRDCGLSACS